LPKIHEWWKEENFYSTADGREMINNFGCITRFLINVAKMKNSTGDTQRKPLKIYLNILKIHFTAIHILSHPSLNKIPFRKIVDSSKMTILECVILSGQKNVSIEALP